MSIIIKKAPTVNETATDDEFKDVNFSGIYMHISDVQKGCAFIAKNLFP